jgi:hypothetical protein
MIVQVAKKLVSVISQSKIVILTKLKVPFWIIFNSLHSSRFNNVQIISGSKVSLFPIICPKIIVVVCIQYILSQNYCPGMYWIHTRFRLFFCPKIIVVVCIQYILSQNYCPGMYWIHTRFCRNVPLYVSGMYWSVVPLYVSGMYWSVVPLYVSGMYWSIVPLHVSGMYWSVVPLYVSGMYWSVVPLYVSGMYWIHTRFCHIVFLFLSYLHQKSYFWQNWKHHSESFLILYILVVSIMSKSYQDQKLVFFRWCFFSLAATVSHVLFVQKLHFGHHSKDNQKPLRFGTKIVTCRHRQEEICPIQWLSR